MFKEVIIEFKNKPVKFFKFYIGIFGLLYLTFSHLFLGTRSAPFYDQHTGHLQIVTGILQSWVNVFRNPHGSAYGVYVIWDLRIYLLVGAIVSIFITLLVRQVIVYIKKRKYIKAVGAIILAFITYAVHYPSVESAIGQITVLVCFFVILTDTRGVKYLSRTIIKVCLNFILVLVT